MIKIKEIIKKYKVLTVLIISFFSVAGLISLQSIYNNNDLYITNNLLNLILFIIYIFSYYKIMKIKIEKREIIFAIVFSLIISTILILGTQLEIYSNLIFNILTIIKIFSLMCSVLPVIILLINFLENYKYKKVNIKRYNFSWKIFLIIFIFNFLVFLALYPGVYGYDAGYLIMVVKDHMQLNSNFSVLYWLIIGNLTNLGKICFDNYQIGFAIYILTQMIFMDLVSTKSIIYIIKKTKNKVLTILSILFFSFFPLYTVMIVSSTQDVFFSGVFALIILEILEMIDNKNYFCLKRNILKFSVLVFLLCAVRNNGLYCLLLASPFVIIFSKQNKIKMFFAIILPLFFYIFIYTGPIFNILNVQKITSFKEMLSIPSQQFARVYNYNISAFKNDDLKLLNKFYTNISTFEVYKYNELIADYAKLSINSEEVKKNLLKYISLWASVGIKDPQNYIEAHMLNTLGFWYPNKIYYDSRMYHPYIEFSMLDAKKWNSNYIEIKRDSKIPKYKEILEIIVEKNAWQNIPIFSLLFSAGFYFILVIFLLSLILLYKNYEYLAPMSVILSLYFTLFLAPVALYRYVFPIVTILPVIISLILCQNKKFS